MLWIINGLIYGFFTALYTLANQKAKLNGYILGIWRGFGIAIIFTPHIFCFRSFRRQYYFPPVSFECTADNSVMVDINPVTIYAII